MIENYNLDYEESVISYFDAKAADYDCVDEQLYWRLSDSLTWAILKTEVLSLLPPKFRFLDAGGGTGRWTCRILEEYPLATGLIYDLSKSMTDQARASADRLCASERLEIVNGRLEEIADAIEGEFDLVFNFHNVLGFVQHPALVIGHLSKFLKSGGQIASMVPNCYHAAFFNVALGQVDEAKDCIEQKCGRFTSTMPKMNLFSPLSITNIHRDAGLEVVRVTGFPCLIYPGYLETQLHGSTDSLQELLSVKKVFDALFQLELQTQLEEGVAARGNNILLMGRKP